MSSYLTVNDLKELFDTGVIKPSSAVVLVFGENDEEYVIKRVGQQRVTSNLTLSIENNIDNLVVNLE